MCTADSNLLFLLYVFCANTNTNVTVLRLKRMSLLCVMLALVDDPFLIGREIQISLTVCRMTCRSECLTTTRWREFTCLRLTLTTSDASLSTPHSRTSSPAVVGNCHHTYSHKHKCSHIKWPHACNFLNFASCNHHHHVFSCFLFTPSLRSSLLAFSLTPTDHSSWMAFPCLAFFLWCGATVCK